MRQTVPTHGRAHRAAVACMALGIAIFTLFAGMGSAMAAATGSGQIPATASFAGSPGPDAYYRITGDGADL
jgi:hypothetical protein